MTDATREHVVLIKNKWTDSTRVYPVLFTKEEAERFCTAQDKTNDIYRIRVIMLETEIKK